MYRQIIAFALAAVCPLAGAMPSTAQEPTPTDVVRTEQAVRVFIDCPDFFCDQEFFRTEINFASHVRERQDADVHVLLTTQRTGAGGTEFTLAFIGQRGFRGLDQTMRHISPPAESTDRVRRALTQTIKRGLIPYVNRTSLAEQIQISYTPPTQQAAPAAALDRWNYWTFRTSLNGFFNGEQRIASENLSTSVSANRITQQWKITNSANARYYEQRFELNPERTITTIQRNYGLNSLVVRSIGENFAAGARASLTSSTFLNQNFALRVAPAVEYNFFPYAEATRRQFTLQYSVGSTAFDYNEETIFGRTSETLLDHRLIASLDVKQPWGSISTSVEGGSYLHDFSQQRGVIFSNIDLRLVRGLSLRSFGSVALIRDQLHLPRRGASEEEILLRQRQLATSYRYWGSVGLSYTFGSTFANVVNPRFSGSSGGMIIMD
ncbi:hypothetical protein BH23GEM3_BH23GEM3_26730 [soil metagenome]